MHLQVRSGRTISTTDRSTWTTTYNESTVCANIGSASNRRGSLVASGAISGGDVSLVLPYERAQSAAEEVANLEAVLDSMHARSELFLDQYLIHSREDRRAGGQGVVQFAVRMLRPPQPLVDMRMCAKRACTLSPRKQATAAVT